MARRRKTSPLEDLVELVALLPWWGRVGLALLSYLVLNSLARPVAMASMQPGQMGPVITQMLWKSLAGVGQIIVPIACLAAAVASALKRRERRNLVGEAFRLQGYRVVETGGGGADGGIDLVLRKDGEKFLVQYKHWKAFKVGVAVIRELYGVMAAQGRRAASS